MKKIVLIFMLLSLSLFADKIKVQMDLDAQGGGRTIVKYVDNVKSLSTDNFKLYAGVALVFRDDLTPPKLNGDERTVSDYTFFRTNIILAGKYKVNPYFVPGFRGVVGLLNVDFDKWNSSQNALIYGDKSAARTYLSPTLDGLIFKYNKHKLSYQTELNFGGHREGGFATTDMKLHEAVYGARYDYSFSKTTVISVGAHQFNDIIDNGQASYKDKEIRTSFGVTFIF